MFETVANNIYTSKTRKSDSRLEIMSKEFLLKNYEEDDGDGDGSGDGDDDQDEKDDYGDAECYQKHRKRARGRQDVLTRASSRGRNERGRPPEPPRLSVPRRCGRKKTGTWAPTCQALGDSPADWVTCGLGVYQVFAGEEMRSYQFAFAISKAI